MSRPQHALWATGGILSVVVIILAGYLSITPLLRLEDQLSTTRMHQSDQLNSGPSATTGDVRTSDLSRPSRASLVSVFGQFIPPENTQLVPAELPTTKLEMVLGGTFTRDKPSLSSALIYLPEEPGIQFYPGDQLPNGAMVQSIHPEAVILKTDSGLESLFLSTNN